MSYVKRQIDAERQHLPTRMWYGFFAEDVGDVSDHAVIIIPDYDPHKKWGRARWQAAAIAISDPAMLESSGNILLEGGAVLLLEESGTVQMPRKGDECLVILDNRNNAWVTCWWPY